MKKLDDFFKSVMSCTITWGNAMTGFQCDREILQKEKLKPPITELWQALNTDPQVTATPWFKQWN